MNRDELTAAMKIPEIMGRGQPYAVIFGDMALSQILSWSQTVTADEAMLTKSKPTDRIRGIRVIHATKVDPWLTVVVTEDEFPDMMRRIGHPDYVE